VRYYNAGMKLRSSGRIIGTAALMVVAILLLCFGSFLYSHQLATGSKVPTGSTAGHPSYAAGKGAIGDRHTVDVRHLVMFMEEADTEDKHPVNASYLTVLLVAFFGSFFGLLIIERRLPSVILRGRPQGPTTSLLEVFRL
jgi:hypothetical protein